MFISIPMQFLWLGIAALVRRGFARALGAVPSEGAVSKACYTLALALGSATPVMCGMMTAQWHYIALQLVLCFVGPGCFIFARSAIAQLTPKAHAARIFALNSMGETASGVVGPLAFAGISAAAGKSRVAFFASCLAILAAIAMLLSTSFAPREYRAVVEGGGQPGEADALLGAHGGGGGGGGGGDFSSSGGGGGGDDVYSDDALEDDADVAVLLAPRVAASTTRKRRVPLPAQESSSEGEELEL